MRTSQLHKIQDAFKIITAKQLLATLTRSYPVSVASRELKGTCMYVLFHLKSFVVVTQKPGFFFFSNLRDSVAEKDNLA